MKALGIICVFSYSITAFAGLPPPEERTVDRLQQMALTEQGREGLLELFNHEGLEQFEMPVGYSSGRGAKVFGSQGVSERLLRALTGDLWKGKIFFESDNESGTEGRNRIQEAFVFHESIIPQGSFVAAIRTLDSSPLYRELVPYVRSPFVILNYAEPARREGKPTTIERLLKRIQVYDVMVPVKGPYEKPVWIGRTWIGEYDPSTGAFTPKWKDRQIAWFFLDFNPEAVAAQIIPESSEKRMFPIPSAQVFPTALH